MSPIFVLLLICSYAGFVSGTAKDGKIKPVGVSGISLKEKEEEEMLKSYDVFFTAAPQTCRPTEGSGTPPGGQEWNPEIITKIRVLKKKSIDGQRLERAFKPLKFFAHADVELKYESNTYKLGGRFILDMPNECATESPECLTPLFSSIRYRKISPSQVDVGVIKPKPRSTGFKCRFYSFVVVKGDKVVKTGGNYDKIDCKLWRQQFTASSSKYTDES